MPTYLSGRNINLLVQSMMSPLQTLNRHFVIWGKEKRVEAQMTSQIILFVPFLNKKFQQYFVNPKDEFSITDRVQIGVPLYHQTAQLPESKKFPLYLDNTSKVALKKEEENITTPNFSFIVWSPQINTDLISEDEYMSMVKYWVDKYKVAGKTYQIKFKNK